MSNLISTNINDVSNYNHPYIDKESKEPYGHICDDGIYRVCYDTTNRYGYSALPIYAVKHDFHDNGYPDHMYRIFIGECPHKEKNGEWNTYEEDVPNFIIRGFQGINYINNEPDVPHLVHLQIDESYYETYYDYKNLDEKINDLQLKIEYCTFSIYIKGLWNRVKQKIQKFVTLTKYNGKRINQYGFKLFKQYLTFCKDKENDSVYIWLETENWWRFIYIKENGKWTLKYKKKENDHCYASCD